MSTRIERNFDFQAAVYFQDSYTLNLYNLKLNMNVVTDCIREQNVALERIKCFLSDCLQDGVFIQSSEKKAIEKFRDAKLKVCTLPEEPYDQIIGIAILIKLNSITEGKISIEEITIGSRLNDDVRMIFNKEEPIGPFLNNGWWRNSNTSINDLSKESKKEKIVKLTKPNDWIDYNLLWEERLENSMREPKKIFFMNETEK
jgi:hypothetical protein